MSYRLAIFKPGAARTYIVLSSNDSLEQQCPILRGNFLQLDVASC